MHGLIDSVPFKAVPYLEYGWVCAPNAAGQAITANTLTTLTLDTEVQDDYGYGSIAGNQVTLAAGTYYFEATLQTSITASCEVIFYLRNVTDSAFITRTKRLANTDYQDNLSLNGQFTLASAKVVSLQIQTGAAKTIGLSAVGVLTSAVAGEDQRTTLKLWKVA